jgi:hypothetical protein
VVLAVVLDGQQRIGVGKIEAGNHRPPPVRHDVLDHWCRQPGQHQQQPQPGLHRGLGQGVRQLDHPLDAPGAPRSGPPLPAKQQIGRSEPGERRKAQVGQRIDGHHPLDEVEPAGEVPGGAFR